MVFNSIKSAMKVGERSPNNSRALQVSNTSPRRAGSFNIIDPSESFKSTDLFSRNALEFINASNGGYNNPYSEQQLLATYMSSVYMFAALKRVANLISRVKIVAETMESESWVRAPQNHPLNLLFQRDTPETLSRMWLNFAIYGSTLAYKIKTRKAVIEERGARPIYNWKDGAVAGVYVLDKPLWEIDEDYTSRNVSGANVNQQLSVHNIMGDRSYLERKEFVYYTDWNPEDPNRGHSLVSVAIHEAVANASIAQWMAEYFTRGAMPFIMVSMEDDPELITDADLRKYKRQFEEYWQGLSSSLRSVFLDRKVSVEQVGISASEVGAPELNETALEGIAATIGLDKELIVTPAGGSQERHNVLVKRAWEDTVIPIAKRFLSAFNKDLGLPSNMRLVLDLSDIAELEADREERSTTEISIYESGMQSYNETRSRLNHHPVEDFDGWLNIDGKLQPIETTVADAALPSERQVEYALAMWDNNLHKRSQVLEILGTILPESEFDGYKMDVEGQYDKLTGLWGEDLLTRYQILERLGLPIVEGYDDGYKSELERGADYGDWILGLWADNLLTRKQTITQLDMGIEIPENFADGYSEEVNNRQSNVLELWDSQLLTRTQALGRLGVQDSPNTLLDGYQAEVEAKLEQVSDAEEILLDKVTSLWGENLLTRRQALDYLNLPGTAPMIDGFQEDVNAETEAKHNIATNNYERTLELWDKNLLLRSGVLDSLGIDNYPDDAFDGYLFEVESFTEARTEVEVNKMREYLEEAPGKPNITLIDDVDLTLPALPLAEDEASLAVGDSQDNWLALQNVINSDEIAAEFDNQADLTESLDDKPYDAAEEEYINNYSDYEWETPKVPYADPLVETFSHSNVPHEQNIADENLTEVNYHPESELDLPERPHNIELGEYYDSSAILADDDDIVIDMDELENAILREYTELQYIDNKESSNHENQTVLVDTTGNTPEAYINFWFGDDSKLTTAQNWIKNQWRDSNTTVNWQDPNTWHITIAYMPNVDNDLLDKALRLMPKSVERLIIEIEGYDYFDNLEDTGAVVLYLKVKETPQLIALQEHIVQALNTYNIELSPYSAIGNWSPHITIGYMSNFPSVEFDLPDNMRIESRCVAIQREDYEHEALIPHTKAAQIDSIKEARAWRKATLRKGVTKGLRFEAQNIDVANVMTVKSDLELSDYSDTQIKTIFERLIARLKRNNS